MQQLQHQGVDACGALVQCSRQDSCVGSRIRGSIIMIAALAVPAACADGVADAVGMGGGVAAQLSEVTVLDSMIFSNHILLLAPLMQRPCWHNIILSSVDCCSLTLLFLLL